MNCVTPEPACLKHLLSRGSPICAKCATSRPSSPSGSDGDDSYPQPEKRENTRHTGTCRERHTYPITSWERSHLRPYEATWRVIAALAKLSEYTLCNESRQVLGVENGIVNTHGQALHIQHVLLLEVLHGVLYPEAHNNGLKKKKKTTATLPSRREVRGKINEYGCLVSH